MWEIYLPFLILGGLGISSKYTTYMLNVIIVYIIRGKWLGTKPLLCRRESRYLYLEASIKSNETFPNSKWIITWDISLMLNYNFLVNYQFEARQKMYYWLGIIHSSILTSHWQENANQHPAPLLCKEPKTYGAR